MTDFYNGDRLLSKKDLDGQTPEIFLVSSNRAAGKTTYFTRRLVSRFLKYGEKFMLIYRFAYELDNVADKFFKDVQALFFPTCEMTEKKKSHGKYVELFINEKSCGYAVALNDSEQIRRLSHLFSDVKTMFFDEFQSETNHYAPREFDKFMSVHNSVARGGGKQSRYLPVYMSSNPVTLLNPYYTALNVCDRLNSKVKYLRGHGFVLEQAYNKSASDALTDSRFNVAFANANSQYLDFAAQAKYLSDKAAFIEKPPKTRGIYIMTVKLGNTNYGIIEYPDSGIVYCNRKPDMTFPVRVSVTLDDMEINYIMLRRNEVYIQMLRYYFDKGCFRFFDQNCKNCVIQLLAYR